MLVINPDECIDCGVCEPECPVEAIVPESEEVLDWVEINRKYAEKWPVLTMQKPALPQAEAFKNMQNKYKEHFSPKPGEGD